MIPQWILWAQKDNKAKKKKSHVKQTLLRNGQSLTWLPGAIFFKIYAEFTISATRLGIRNEKHALRLYFFCFRFI